MRPAPRALPGHRLLENTHEVPAHDSIYVTLAKASQLEVRRNQPDIVFSTESCQHARNPIDVSSYAQMFCSDQVSNVTGMAHKCFQVGGAITLVMIRPETHNPVRSSYGGDFAVVEQTPEILNFPRSRVRSHNWKPGAFDYVKESCLV